MITMIAAIAENRVLGKDNQLLWHLPDDFKRFKQRTSNHKIVMGRKTFESLPGKLHNRTHFILTRSKDYEQTDCTILHSVEDIYKIVEHEEEIFIIGGGEIYSLCLPIANCIELTKVHTVIDGDAFFPEMDANEWELVHQEYHPKDEKHKFDFTFETYKRKTPAK